MVRKYPSISFEIVTSDILKIFEISFLFNPRLLVFETSRIHPAATEGGSCVDAKSNVLIFFEISTALSYFYQSIIF